MPLFRRPDGVLVRDLPNVRRIMPHIMRGRNESAVYHKSTYDLTRTLSWLARYNEDRDTKATLFHLFLHACARAFHERPGLNRFVSGGNIYERRNVELSFAAKKAFDDNAPIVTVKIPFPKEDTFDQTVERITASISKGRGGEKTTVDTELKLALALPNSMLSMVLGFLRWLDSVNLMPGSMIASDPMYASMFAANLGSVGIGDTFHHLYEYGTIGVFGVMGKIEKKLIANEDGSVSTRDGIDVCWTFDERINDGFYCASSLKIAQRIVEDPETQL